MSSLPKKKRGRKRKFDTDDPNILREIHKSNEKKRRADMRHEFTQLKALVPGLSRKTNNLAVLQATVKHVRLLTDYMERLAAEFEKAHAGKPFPWAELESCMPRISTDTNSASSLEGYGGDMSDEDDADDDDASAENRRYGCTVESMYFIV
jgi:hypothetical protein